LHQLAQMLQQQFLVQSVQCLVRYMVAHLLAF
jgi:hypothetical protein